MNREITAQLNHLRMSPRKVRIVAQLVKGFTVERAELELQTKVKRVARPLLKLLQSAIANARQNFQIAKQGLYIKDIRVNSGVTLKRSRPRAFGRAAAIRKRTSRIILVLVDRGGVASGDANEVASPEEKNRAAKEKRAQGKKRTFSRMDQLSTGSAPKSEGFVKKIFRRKSV